MNKFYIALIGTMAMLLLVGCQFLIRDDLPPAPPKTEIFMLGWQSSPSYDARLQQSLDQIVASSATLSVSLTLVNDYDEQLTAALDSDYPPDIIFVESGRLVELAHSGMLRAIGDQVEGTDDFFPVLRQAFTFRGQFYCPPREFSTLAVVYNSQMLDDAAIPYPTDDWTWQDFSSTVQKLTNPNTAVVGLALGNDLSRWLPFLYAAGGTLTDSNETTMTLNSPAVAAGFHVLDDLWTNFDALKPADMRTSWAGEALGKQRAAMAIEGDWTVPYLQKEFPELKFGIVALPTGTQTKSTMAFSSCLAIPAKAAHPEEALKVINQLVSADIMRALHTDPSPIPARISVAEQWQSQFPQMKPFVDGAAYAHPWRFFPGFDALKSNMEGNLQRMYKAEISVEDLLLAAEEAGNRALKETK